MIRVQNGETEQVLSMDDFEKKVRRGEISPHALVSIPALTGDALVEARTLPMFAAAYDPRRLLFRQHFQVGRVPLITGIAVAVCVLLWWVARDLGGGVVTRDVLLQLGAKSRARIVDEGQTWRLLTASFLHRDAVHLGFNLFALVSVGAVLEGIYRRGDYVVVLVLCGLACMTCSAVFSPPVTVGASGMIFGCLGCAVVFGLRFADVLPLRYRVYFGVVLVGYSAASFWLGLLRSTTDNWGHAGGLLCGLVMGAVLEPRLLRLKTVRESPAQVARPWLISTAVVVLVCAVGPLLPMAFLRFVPTSFGAFGVAIERPQTWTKGPDPLGFIAFGNGVDALTSLACARVTDWPTLGQAMERFVDGELMGLMRAGHIADLVVDPAVDDVIDQTRRIPARRLSFSFVASDGRFSSSAWVFLRGEIECAVVAAHRVDASTHSVALLQEIIQRLRIVDTDSEVKARAAAEAHPESTKAWLELALAAERAGDIDVARQAFDKALATAAREPSWLPRVAVGRAQFELGFGHDLDVAAAVMAQAMAVGKGDADVVSTMIDVLKARHDDAAARALQKSAAVQFVGDDRFAVPAP